jgi:hypothetical protein
VEEIFAAGNTVTVTVNPAEVHPPGTFGVTKYVAVPTDEPEFVKVPLKPLAFVAADPADNDPLIDGAPQLYVVELGIVPVNVGLKLTPLHTEIDTLLMLAAGNTPTVTVNPAEVQPPGTVGVIK